MSDGGTRLARPARERVLAAALDLFAEHGVSGTSLQMIADRLGVTKAAVYHQFQTKDDIVLAVIGPALDALVRIADAAEQQRTRARQLDYVLRGVVELVVANRRLAAILQFDPMVDRLVRSHRAHPALERIRCLFTGTDPDAATSVAAAMVGGGLMLAGIDPTLATFSEDELRQHLIGVASRILRHRAPPV